MSSNSTIDYLSKDYDGLRESMLDFATRTMPEWQSRSESDFGVAMVELMAYMGDILSYYGDRIQGEAYLPTATQRASLLQISRMLGYVPSNGVAATGTVTFQNNNTTKAVTVPAGTKVVTDYIDTLDAPITYETTADTTLAAKAKVAVPVIHGVTRSNVVLGVSTGVPGQTFRIPETSVLADSVQVFVATSTDPSGALVTQEWLALDALVDADGNDTAFTTYNDEFGSTWVEFGDSINGAIPNIGLNIYVTYRVGGGLVGNIAANQIVAIASTLAGVQIAQDTSGHPISSEMAGGADAESNEQIRSNAPRVFRAQDRAVTLTDFADVALSVPGILRANAVAGTYTSVTVYVVGPNGLSPGATLMSSVQKALEKKSLAGTSVTVAAPSFVKVNVGASGATIAVTVYDKYKQASVAKDVEMAIRSMLAFANVDFGMRLTVSDFYSAIMSIPGVKYVSIPMIARADAAQTGTADMVFRPWEIPVIGNLVITANGGIA